MPEIRNKTDTAYLAGILDGEGSICMTRVAGRKNKLKGYWKIVVSVGNCDKKLIEWLSEWCGSTLMNMDRGKKKRLQHRWTVVGRDAEFVLSKTLPFLIVKEKRAKWALEVLKIQKEKRVLFTQYPKNVKIRLNNIRRKFDTDEEVSLSVANRKKYAGEI